MRAAIGLAQQELVYLHQLARALALKQSIEELDLVLDSQARKACRYRLYDLRDLAAASGRGVTLDRAARYHLGRYSWPALSEKNTSPEELFRAIHELDECFGSLDSKRKTA